MTAKRKSVALSKTARGEILHQFFMDVSRQAREELLEIEHTLAGQVYDIIYGYMREDILHVPETMFNLYECIPLTGVSVTAKKRKRIKGKIEPTTKVTYQFKRFSAYVNLDKASAVVDHADIRLPHGMPQYPNTMAPRNHWDHLDRLKKRELISAKDIKLIETAYVAACKKASKVIAPVVEIMTGVFEILDSVKTTKGLLSAWPECENFLTLPDQSLGALMKVDIGGLNDALGNLYPPAEKTEAA